MPGWNRKYHVAKMYIFRIIVFLYFIVFIHNSLDSEFHLVSMCSLWLVHIFVSLDTYFITQLLGSLCQIWFLFRYKIGNISFPFILTVSLCLHYNTVQLTEQYIHLLLYLILVRIYEPRINICMLDLYISHIISWSTNFIDNITTTNSFRSSVIWSFICTLLRCNILKKHVHLCFLYFQIGDYRIPYKSTNNFE